MVQAILNGQMTIEYEQMILATGSGSEETILEGRLRITLLSASSDEGATSRLESTSRKWCWRN